MDGLWCEGEDQLVGLFMDYFQHPFRSSNSVSEHMEAVLANTPHLVSSEMNQSLLSELTKAEVDLALKQMSPLKAFGPNGMSPIFYQHYWEGIKGDVSQAVLSCLNSGIIPPNLNHTYIILVLKVKNP